MSLVFVPDNFTDRSLCRNLSIVADNVVEDPEVFFLLLNSSDPAVILSDSLNNATITIIDRSSKFYVQVVQWSDRLWLLYS